MKRFILLACSAITCTAASLTGIVSDPQGAVVVGASVSLFASTGDAQFKTLSDGSGKYEFGDIAAGDYLLEARASGFAANHVENIHVPDTGEVRRDLPLAVGTVEQEISVTAAATPQAVDQVAKALTVIDSSSLQARQDYTLTDAIRLTPGVRVSQQGGPGAFSEIRLRGLRAQDTAVLVDGMRLRDASGTQADASGLVEDFLMTDASRIEILRGSGSSLYGTNAIGGVVNVLTDAGGGPARGWLQLEGGSLGLFRGNAGVAGGTKDDRIQYSAGIVHLNVTEGLDGYDAARTSAAQGRLTYRLNATTQVSLRFMGSQSFSMLNSEPVGTAADNITGIIDAVPGTTFTPGPNDSDYMRRGRFDSGELSLTGQPAASLGYAVDYQILDSARRYDNGPGGTGPQPFGTTRSDFHGRIQTLNARANLQVGRHNLLTGGYEFENEHFDDASSALPDMSSDSALGVTQTSHAVFGQDQLRLLDDRLYVSLGFRTQAFSLSQPTFDPVATAPYKGLRLNAPPAAYTGDGSLAYFFRHSGTKLRAHVGRGYRAPALYERFGAGYDSFFGYSVYGSPNLQPEQSISVDAGVDQAALNGKLRVSGTYFYTRLQRVVAFDFSGLIDPATDPYGRFMGYLNTHGGLARGVELSGEWAVNGGLTVYGAYTYTDARERTPLVPGVYRTFITPEHQFAATAVQRLGKRVLVDFALNAGSNYLTEMYNADFTGGAYRFPGYKRADVGVSYRVPMSEKTAVRLFAKGQNIFDQTYYESGFRTPGATVRGGMQFEF